MYNIDVEHKVLVKDNIDQLVLQLILIFTQLIACIKYESKIKIMILKNIDDVKL